MLYQLGTNGAFLLLSALGLIVILGMMNIINLAHGELMMLGAYTATIVVHRGVPFPLAVSLAFFAVALFGAVLERLIVRRFYGRELGALVVTWGISLILSQGTLLLLGPFMPSIQIPGGSVAVGQYSFSVYWLILIARDCGRGRLALVVALQPHHLRPSGARDDAERRHGACARRRHRPDLHADLQPWRRARRLQRRAAGADHLDRALHGPAVRRASLHHRRGRRGDQRHHRGGRARSLLLSLVRTPSDFCSAPSSASWRSCSPR